MLGTESPLFLKLFQQLPKVLPNKKLHNTGYAHTSGAAHRICLCSV